MIEEKNIKEILDKFYLGATTVEEEKALEEYFDYTPIVLEDLKVDKELFLSMKAERVRTQEIRVVPLQLDSNLNKLIESLDEKNRKARKEKTPFWYIAGIAASVIVLLSVSLYLFNVRNDNNSIDISRVHQPATQEEAMQQTSKALLLLSEKLNKADSQLEMMDGKIEKVKKDFNDNIK